MKSLLFTTAIFEGSTGVALLSVPAFVVHLLLGTKLDDAAQMIVSRIAGAALLSLAIICWSSRNGEASVIVKAMLVYNLMASALLVYAAMILPFAPLPLWLVMVLHAMFAIWCAVALNLRQRSVQSL